MESSIMVVAGVCLVGLILAARVTVAAYKYVDKIGDDPKLKRQSLERSLFNFYAVLVLSFVVLVRALDFIGNELFIGLFSLIVGALGFKLTKEVFGG